MRIAILMSSLLFAAIAHSEPLKPGDAFVANADGGVVAVFLHADSRCQFDARSPEGQWLSSDCAYRIVGDKLTIEFPRPLPGDGPKDLSLVYSEARDTLTLSPTKTLRRTTHADAMAELKK